MASKISQLTEDTAPTHDDLIETVHDPGGTPASRKVKLSNLFFAIQQWVFGADAGSTDTYVVTLSPAPAAYVTGQHYRFKANTANTGACTVNFNSLGAKTIKKAAGGITTDLADNDIRAGQWVDLVYDGTNMQMQSLLGNAPAGGSGGIGDVVGPGSATDNAVARFDSTTGKLIQNSTVTLDDVGALTVPEMAAPSTPATGKVSIYAKTDGKLYIKDDAGTETDLTATGAGGAEAGANSDITSMDGLTGALETPTRIDFAEGAAPSTPGTGKVSLYAKADGLLYSKDDAGTETVVTGGGGGGGAPGGSDGDIQYRVDASTFGGSPAKREDANTVALRNGNTGQTLNIYGNFIDASNYSRLRLKGTNASAFEIKSENAGTGGLQTLEIGVGATNKITIGTGTVNPTNNAFDLGGSSNRWSVIYGTHVHAATSLQVNNNKLSQQASAPNGCWVFTDTSDNPGTWTALSRSPSTLSADQNNYNPSSGYFQRWNSDASRNVTGLSLSQISGQVHLIVNVGSNDIVLVHESASSTAANRFLCSTGANITLSANQAADLIYDAATQRWRVFKRN